ncbi:MAG: GNAT family N-acetyltransferase, partial [Steroidobacteraceae bacterium]
GFAHAWIQDVMVAASARRQRIGVRLVHTARDEAARAGCDFLHVDFEERLQRFYIDECGFSAVQGGLIRLR